MNKTTKKVIAGASIAAALAVVAPVAANAAPGGDGGGPSCAAWAAHIAKYEGSNLGQLNKLYKSEGMPQEYWVEVAHTKLLESYGCCGL